MRGHPAYFTLTASSEAFSDELTKLMIPPSHTGNALVSPFSLFTALSMLLLAAKGPTKQAVYSTLQIKDNTAQERIHSEYGEFTEFARKHSLRNDTKLVIANKFLLSKVHSKNKPLLKSFEDALREKFNTSVDMVDFIRHKEQIQRDVNEWVKLVTQGLIPQLMQQPPEPSNVFLILNTLYFQANWDQIFESKFSSAFYSDTGKQKKVQFMETTGDFKFLKQPSPLIGSKDIFDTISIDYSSPFKITLILPPKNASLNHVFEAKKILRMAKTLHEEGKREAIKLSMPTFKFKSDVSLKETLRAMGAEILFTSPDLSGINNSTELVVSDVKHATVIEVDQAGTKAAASTSIPVNMKAFAQWTEISINRPFAFVIQDNIFSAPLFVGKVGDPSDI